MNRQYDGMWEIQWAVENCRIIRTRYRGLFLIEAGEEALQLIRSYDTTAICRVIPLDDLIRADLTTISERTLSIAEKKLGGGEKFAVRCKRRGFSVPSMEIERDIGAQIVAAMGNPVDLENPDKVVFIEIIDKKAGIAVLSESEIVEKEIIDL
ncbi:MAG: RNA-binding protein [Theionarchaea archaeon]|nr:RNA-binding protein [Theionarchaea archaeon]MBU7000460.1 RNA-binding protein [Theionarchaea archaeon]MBU7020013.1 RNA-binding protein [Theionarchaea archaeon]MBU7035452.1 RNA-binding protein [Theionarchaea archaeon]